jgi:1-acyl-sn-glycerol-3-phosphate acyltransferase
MLATMPRPVAFVVKQEMRAVPVARFVLERIGARFVERFAVVESVADAQKLAVAARTGEPLFFFAEGTFRAEPGLLPFRLGAFITAAAGGAPLVPLALRGTRDVLYGDEWWPRWGDVAVTVGEPILPAGSGWDAALALRDSAREFILKHCGEPDCGDVR